MKIKFPLASPYGPLSLQSLSTSLMNNFLATPGYSGWLLEKTNGWILLFLFTYIQYSRSKLIWTVENCMSISMNKLYIDSRDKSCKYIVWPIYMTFRKLKLRAKLISGVRYQGSCLWRGEVAGREHKGGTSGVLEMLVSWSGCWPHGQACFEKIHQAVYRPGLCVSFSIYVKLQWECTLKKYCLVQKLHWADQCWCDSCAFVF